MEPMTTAPADRWILLYYIPEVPPLQGRWSAGWNIWVYEKFDTFKENNDLQPCGWKEIDEDEGLVICPTCMGTGTHPYDDVCSCDGGYVDPNRKVEPLDFD